MHKLNPEPILEHLARAWHQKVCRVTKMNEFPIISKTSVRSIDRKISK